MEIHPKGLGKAVAEVRRARGVTQKEVAKLSGFTVNFLSLVENGERALSLDGLNRLATICTLSNRLKTLPFFSETGLPRRHDTLVISVHG